MSMYNVQNGEVVFGYTGVLLQVVNSGGAAVGTVLQARDGISGRQDVKWGGVASGTVISSGGMQDVTGTAADTIVFSGGTQRLLASQRISGSAYGTIVHLNGVQAVLNGAMAYGTELRSGGMQDVSDGGRASGTIISSGGMQVVSKGGSAIDVIQRAGGLIDADLAPETVVYGVNAEGGAMKLSGGTASGFILYGGIRQAVSSGCTAVETVLQGGSQHVSSGGTASGTMLLSGGVQNVIGVAVSSVVSSGGRQIVSASTSLRGLSPNYDVFVWGITNGGKAVGTVVASGGELLVSLGGKATEISQIDGGNVNACVLGNDTKTLVSGSNRNGAFKLADGVASGFIVWTDGWQAVSSDGIASGTILSGGRQTLSSGGTAAGTKIVDGWQHVSNGGTASGTTVLADGQQIVYGGGSAHGTTVSSGGLMLVKTGGYASSVRLKAGAEAAFAGGNVLGGKNAFAGAEVRGGKASRQVRLKAGGSLALGAGNDMSGLHLKVAGASLAVSGAGNTLGSLLLDSASKLSFDVSGLGASGDTTMLSLTAKNQQKLGAFSLNVGKRQKVGVYELASGFEQISAAAWKVYVGGLAAGTASLDGKAVVLGGFSYSVRTSGGRIDLSVEAKAGKTVCACSSGGVYKGGSACDVFLGGRGNDVFRPGIGHDCGVWGTGAWGRDTVAAKTSGTMTVVFKSLKASDVVSSLTGTTMIFAKKTDTKQTVTVKGWSSTTHSVVFGGAMNAVAAWAKAATPTNAQIRAARTEVWRKAGLAAA